MYQPSANPISLSEKFSACVDGRSLPVYCGADFDFVHLTTSDAENLIVTVSEDVERLDIRPTRRQKKYQLLDARTVSPTVCRGDYLSFEVNGNIERPRLIFADEAIPFGGYEGYNVIAFTKAGFYRVGPLVLSSHTIVYIGEGAIVDARLGGEEVKDVRILGNGVLYCAEKTSNSPICFRNSEDVEIRGITIIGKNRWNCHLNNCRNVLVENFKILADEIWSDGIDIVGGENVLVRHIFIKNEDDCVCIKSSYSRKGNFQGFDVRNVLIEDCVFWNGPRGNSMEIGYETNNSVVERVVFRNVDVIHRETQENKFNRCIISIHNSGNADIHDILYEDIYAESTDENFVQIAHMYQPDWGQGRGSMENITIRRLTLAGGELRASKVSSFAPGETEPRITRNIVFEDLVILGDPIKSIEDAVSHGFHLDPDPSNVRFL